jgi:Phage-related minor tail protein
MIVGVADLLVSLVLDPDSEAKLKAESDAALGGFGKDADKAGKDAGEDLRGGVKDGTKDIEGDLGEAGAAGGMALRDGVKDGSAGIEDDLAQAGILGGVGLRDGVKDSTHRLANDLGDAGALGGTNLREGVGKETDKLADDLEKDGDNAGGRFAKATGKGLEKLSDLAANTGLPIGGLSSKLDDAGKSLQDVDHKSSSLGDSLDHLGGYALAGVAAAGAVVGVVTVKMAEGMQTAEAKIKSSEEITTAASKEVGNAFLKQGASAEFSGNAMTEAFASVAGQLRASAGHALNTAESYEVMHAASNLAEAGQIGIGEATQATAGVMQAFVLKAGEAGHVTDVLYSASNRTKLGVSELATQLEKLRGKLGDESGSVGELAGTLVAMTDHGIAGRTALQALNTGMTTLLKTSDGTASAVAAQGSAYDALSPQLKVLAKQYQDGAVSSEAFKKETESLPPAQEQALAAFTKASTAVQTAQLKYKELGLTVFDAQNRFVGMGSIIAQVQPRLEAMHSPQEKLAFATQLFGSAAKSLLPVLEAGTGAYDRNTREIEKKKTAEKAAEGQAKTLSGETKELSKDFDNTAVVIGQFLLPIVTKMTGVFVSATTYVLQHKEILVALAAVVTGVLGTAITVFTINKMAAFGRSFVTAGETVKAFASKVVASMGTADAGIEGTATAAGTAETNIAASTGEMDASFEGVGAAAGTADAEVGTAMTGMVGEVEAGDTAIEGANVAAGASFTAMLAPIAAVVGALVAGYAVIKGVEAGLKAITGEASNVSELLGGGQPGEKGKEGEGGGPYKLKAHAGAQQGGGSVEQEIVKFFESKGFSPNAAAGFAGNAAQESSFDPNAGGGGLYQQSGDGASGTGTVAEQSQQVLERLSPSLKGALNAAKSPGEAADLIMKDFEKPEGSQPGETSPSAIANANLAHREQAATQALEHSGAATTKNTGAVEGLTNAIKPASTSGTSTPAAKTGESSYAAEGKATKAKEAATKAALDKEVKAQEAALHDWVGKMVAEEAKVGPVRLAAIRQEVSEHQKMVATEIADEKAGDSKKEATAKATSQKVVNETAAGQKELSKLQVAVSKGSLSELNVDLDKTHAGMLMGLEGKLQDTHKAALEKLTSQLVKVWQAAEAQKANIEKSERAAAAATERASADEARNKEVEAAQKNTEEWFARDEEATIAGINKSSAIAANQTASVVQGIEDAAKVQLDKNAEVGLSGAELTTAKAQTSLDEITATNDAAIKSAELHSAEVSGTGKIAEAQAASALQTAQSTAALQEAQAKATLELDKGAQTTAASATAAPMIFNIYGTNMTASEAAGAIGWLEKTGALPVAAAPGVTAVPA